MPCGGSKGWVPRHLHAAALGICSCLALTAVLLHGLPADLTCFDLLLHFGLIHAVDVCISTFLGLYSYVDLAPQSLYCLYQVCPTPGH